MFRFGRCFRFSRRGFGFKFGMRCRGNTGRFLNGNEYRNGMVGSKEEEKIVLQKQLNDLEVQKKYIENQLKNF